MATQPLPLSVLCDVSVSVSASGVAVPAFNQGLIVGNSNRIPSQGAGSRCVLFGSLASMIAYGFQPTDPEYISAGLYFGQNAAPVTPPEFLWVGCQDPTAIAAITIDSGSAGTGWAVGDIFLITQAGASFGYGQVTAQAGGVPTAVAFISGRQGTAYSVANALATVAQSPSVGTGLEVNITAIGETPLQAIAACRLAQPNWYVAMSTTAVDADHLAIAAFAQTAQPAMQYLYGTQSIGAQTGATGNIFSLIKAQSYGRAHGAYSTVQGGAAPNNQYIAAAIMGVAMGLNTGAPNSNFSLAAKSLVGITVEPLTLAQINVFAGTPGLGFGNNGNSYNNYANSYQFYYQGVNGNGMSFMDVLGLDMLAADAQLSVLNVLKSLPSIPQDDPGQALVLNAVRGAGARSANRGFLAPGTWNGQAIPLVPNGGLAPGTSLSSGYWAGSSSFSTQTSGDKALFKSMPVYMAVIRAGTQQSFTIGISVQ